jgi:hypothetical protein
LNHSPHLSGTASWVRTTSRHLRRPCR